MAFLDKLNDFAKNISDKTNDTIEINKHNSKISAETKLANEEMKKIGEFYYGKYAEGLEVAPEVIEFCEAAKAHYEAAAAAQAEIDRIHAENEAQKAAAEAAKAEAQSAASTSTVTPVDTPEITVTASSACPACGASLAPDTKFCSSCGTKIEIAAPVVPEPEPIAPTTCPGCGTTVNEGAKFCGSCGTRIE